MKKLLLCMILIGGCSSSQLDEFTQFVPQTLTTNNGSYTGQGITSTRHVKAVGIASPWGKTAKEVVTDVKPMTVQVGDSPTIAVNGKTGDVKIGKGDNTELATSGGRGNWWDTVKGWFSGWFTIAIVIVVACLVLPILFPFLAPIFTGIYGAVKAVAGWVWDELEALIGWIKTKTAKPTPVIPVVITATVTPAPAVPAPEKPEVKPII